MYSVVLMMALTGGAETTEFGGNRCCGCTGAPVVCSGYAAACCGRTHHHVHHVRCTGCTGYVCSGSVCTGYSSCSGSSCHGGGLFSRLHNRCHGSCSGYVAPVCAPVAPCCGTTVPAAVPPVPPAPPKKMPTDARSTAPATIIVMVPADARLTVDGNATTSTTARRVLVTPSLEVGSEYVYSLTASVVVDGQIVPQTQNVTVRGGSTTQVSFDFATTVASR